MAALPSLRQLSYLVTLSETLHFTEAARRSFVTQSTLSGGIMELERLLGGVLVERDRQNVRLTPLGEQVVARARVLLADAQDLMRLSREMSEPLTGDLHLGIIPTIAPFILTQLLDEVHRQLPKIQLHLHEAQSEKIVEKLEHGNLDMIVLALPFDTRGLKVAEIAKEKEINGVITAATDYGILTVARIAETMNLPGISYEIAKTVKNKYLIRKKISTPHSPKRTLVAEK